MDIFGKSRTSPGSTKKTSFQQELDNKMRERRSLGLGAELTSEEDDNEALASDDDLLAAFQQTTKPNKARSQSPWKPGQESHQSAQRQNISPQQQSNSNSFLKSLKTDKKKIPIKPQNELDRLLMDDNDELNERKQMKKQWQPPTFKDFSAKDSTEHRKSPLVGDEFRTNTTRDGSSYYGSGRSTPHSGQRTPIVEMADSDEELAGAYQKTLMRTQSSVTSESKQGQFSGKQSSSEKLRQSPNIGNNSARQSPFSKQFRATPEEKPQQGGLNKVFGQKSPKDFTARDDERQDKDGSRFDPFGRKSPKDFTARDDERLDKDGSRFDPFSRKSPKAQERMNADSFNRKAQRKDQDGDKFDRKSPKIQEQLREDSYERKLPRQNQADDRYGRKSPKQTKTLDQMFGSQASYGRKSPQEKLAESKDQRVPVPQRRGMRNQEAVHEAATESTVRRGSYMSSLLGDDEPEKNAEQPSRAARRSSYLNDLLGDEKDERNVKRQPQPSGKTSYMDSLLAEEPQQERKPRPRKRTSFSEKGQNEASAERESSLCRDVNKDPQMIEQIEKVKAERKSQNSRNLQTQSQKADFLIDEVAEAQQSSVMTFIEPQSTSDTTSTPVKPKPRKKVATSEHLDSSTRSFDSTADIRKYIYEDWKNKKSALTKAELLEKKKLEKEAEQQKLKEEQEKLLEKTAVYRTWKEQKDEELRIKLREARKAEKLKEEEMRKQAEKKKESEKVLKGWKEKKDELLKANAEKMRKEQINKLTEEQERKEAKKKYAETAFVGWKKKKDIQIKGTVCLQKTIAKNEKQMTKEEARRREMKAEELYEKWLESKEKQKLREKRQKKIREQNYADEQRPAWSPANRTIVYRH